MQCSVRRQATVNMIEDSQEGLASRLPVYKRVHAALGERILGGACAVGHYLPSERALAEEFGVSRASVRHAVSNLQKEGLVTVYPTRGVMVKDLREGERGPTKAASPRLVGLVAPWLVHYAEAGLLLVPAIRGVLNRHAFDLLLCDTFAAGILRQLRRERESLESLITRGVAGAIVFYQGEEWNLKLLRSVQKHGIPIVLIDREVPGFACDAVLMDNEQAGYLATCHLIEGGHRRIAHITAPWNISSVNDRLAGYRRALEEHGIAFDPHLVACHSDDMRGSAVSAVEEFLSLKERPTAIFALHDEVAFFAWVELERAGVRVPEEMALVGVNNFRPEYRMEDGKTCRLTTIEQPLSSIAAAAAELLCKRILKGPAAEPEVVRFPPRLIVRDSSVPGAREAAREETAEERALRPAAAALVPT